MGFNLTKTLAHFLCCFIPKKSVRKAVRYYFSLREVAKTNTIEMEKGQEKYVGLHVDGHNNRIVIKKMSSASKGKLSISLTGDGCTVVIDEGLYIGQSLSIIISQRAPYFGPISDVTVKIGSHSSFEKAEIITFNSHSSIRIGSDCMVSSNVFLYHTDGHPVLDRETGKIINRVHELSIGDHCWIGYNATILKNVRLGRDCIVAWGTVVTSGVCKDSVPEGCVLAGHPAKIVKRGISWSRGSDDFMRNLP